MAITLRRWRALYVSATLMSITFGTARAKDYTAAILNCTPALIVLDTPHVGIRSPFTAGEIAKIQQKMQKSTFDTCQPSPELRRSPFAQDRHRQLTFSPSTSIELLANFNLGKPSPHDFKIVAWFWPQGTLGLARTERCSLGVLGSHD